MPNPSTKNKSFLDKIASNVLAFLGFSQREVSPCVKERGKSKTFLKRTKLRTRKIQTKKTPAKEPRKIEDAEKISEIEERLRKIEMAQFDVAIKHSGQVMRIIESLGDLIGEIERGARSLSIKLRGSGIKGSLMPYLKALNQVLAGDATVAAVEEVETILKRIGLFRENPLFEEFRSKTLAFVEEANDFNDRTTVGANGYLFWQLTGKSVRKYLVIPPSEIPYDVKVHRAFGDVEEDSRATLESCLLSGLINENEDILIKPLVTVTVND